MILIPLKAIELLPNRVHIAQQFNRDYRIIWYILFDDFLKPLAAYGENFFCHKDASQNVSDGVKSRLCGGADSFAIITMQRRAVNEGDLWYNRRNI